MLSREQEQRLFERLGHGDAAARTRLLTANRTLVRKIASRYRANDKGLSLRDLVGIGEKGLERAIEKYDPSSPFKFSTYASWWIRAGIHRTLGLDDD